MHRSILTYFIALLVFTATLTGCAVNPVTGKTELSFVSEAEEINIGRQQYLPSQQSQGGIYHVNLELSEYVSEVGQRIARVSDRALPYEFVVLNNSVPNAWALPGGKIAVNRGLLLKLNSEAELAAVLGHEVVHAAARHGAKSMERGTLLQGAMIAAAIGAADSDYSNYIVGGAQLGAQLLTQRYGRGAELESDYYGIQYMVRAGYDPAAAISLQETFVELSAGRSTNWIEGLFASHPPSQERVDKNRETVAALSPLLTTDLQIGKERFNRKLAYLVSKQDAYTAFDQAKTLVAANELDSASRLLDQAIRLEPREARFYGLKGDISLERKRYKQATVEFSEALDLDPDYYEYYLGRGLATLNLGRRQAARKDLNRSNDLLPTAIAMNKLGQMALQDGNTAGAKRYFQNAMSAGGNEGHAASVAFTKLDLPDNPARYFTIKPYLENNTLKARISNRASVDVSRIDVNFALRLNGEEIQRTITLGPIRAGQQLQKGSGFRFREEDLVENLRVTVRAARL